MRSKLAVAVVVGLLLVAAIDRVLWSPPPDDPAQPRLASNASPFPAFPAKPTLFVVSVPADTNASTRLTLLSIQGLVNREGAEVYLDERKELGNASSMLTFLAQRYGVTYGTGGIGAAFARYLPGLDGLVVFDPARPESVNVATLYAALHKAAIAGPDTALSLSRAYGLPILFDYAASDWSRLSASEAYDRALSEFYPQATHELLSILPPNRFGIRDYLIAAKAFVFYYPQGALTAGPGDLAATTRILRATPRGMPILGWVDTPTITEENAFVQLVSREGKILVGAQDTPNLSVLTAFGRGTSWRQAPIPPGPPRSEATTYAVVAVPDGDNVDFVSGRMRQLWDDPARGSVPVTWSISPILADLAPPFLEYYGTTATPNDRFVAGPSGAGYVYPDYMAAGDLGPYLSFSRRYLNATGLDTAWLLNAFPASEVPYRDSTLAAYVDGLRPNGLVLDYADQAKTQDYWMQIGDDVAAPVIRSTHLWTTKENFLAKLGAAAAAWDGGAHFLWVTVYPYRFNLTAAMAVLSEASARLPGGLEIVTPERLFALLRQDFVEKAGREVRALGDDPLAAGLFGRRWTSANDHLARARSAAGANDANGAAREAYLALGEVRAARLGEAILLIVLVLAVPAMLVSWRRMARSPDGDVRASGAPFILLTATFATFFLVLRTSLAADFWTYPFVLAGLVLAGFGVPLANHLGAAYPRRAATAACLLFATFAALAAMTNAAFPLAGIGAVLVAESVLSRGTVRPPDLVMTFALGAAIGFLLDAGLWSLAILVPFLLLPSLLLPPRSRAGRGRRSGALLAGLGLALPLSGLAAASTYSLSLRLDLDGPSLATVAPLLVATGVIGGVIAYRSSARVRPAALQVGGFLAAALSAGLLLVVQGSLATALALFVLVASLAVSGTATLRRFSEAGGDLRAAVRPGLVFSSLLVLVFRIPPIVYSLSLGPLPEFVEAGFYAPQIFLGLVAFAGVAIVLVGGLRAWTAKHYPEDPDGGGRE